MMRPPQFFLSIALTASLACSGSSSDSAVGGSGGAAGAGGTGGQAGTGGEAGQGGAGGQGGQGGVGGGHSEWRLFITNTAHTANLDGIAGADEICAAQASAAGLEGRYQAWLSTKDSAVADRVVHADGPYILVDGTMVAEDWDDLVDGTILVPIDRDASGVRRVGEAWTGTLATGAPYPDDDCDGFMNEGNADVALCGDSMSTSSTWTENITPTCDTHLRLYCIQQ